MLSAALLNTGMYAIIRFQALTHAQLGTHEIVLEQLLRLNLIAFGHRCLFDVVAPGGVRRAPAIEQIRGRLPAILDEFRYVVNALLITNSHVDRLEATGVVSPEDAHRLSLVGPVARASGESIDVRRDHPTGVGDEPTPLVPVQAAGDVLARMRVMVGEVEESAQLIEAHLADAGAGCSPLREGSGSGLGWAESPRGEALAWVFLTGDGRIERARLRPASVCNWRAFDDAARAQNVFTDMPIIERARLRRSRGTVRTGPLPLRGPADLRPLPLPPAHPARTGTREPGSPDSERRRQPISVLPVRRGHHRVRRVRDVVGG
jgi:Ni,Fe-hydrogenase III large subunit